MYTASIVLLIDYNLTWLPHQEKLNQFINSLRR